MMRGEFYVRNPDEVEMKMVFVATCKEWKEIRDQLIQAKDYWPCKGMSQVITEMVGQMNDSIFAAPTPTETKEGTP